MFELKNYVAAASLAEADALLHADRRHVILGGLLWMRLGRSSYDTGIDLSRLGLDTIRDTGHGVEIGCMTSLRDLETSPVLAARYGALFSRAVGHIVGVQFRNGATVGGSVASRLGFSDVITALLALDTRVHLFRAGEMPLSTFLDQPAQRDILVKLMLPGEPAQTAYHSVRRSATDFPVLSCSVGYCRGQWRVAVGARPSRACAVTLPSDLSVSAGANHIAAAAVQGVQEMTFGTNPRGSAAYRRHLAAVLVTRGITEICSFLAP